MTRDETIMVLAVLRAAYPSFYSKSGDADLQAAVNLWHKCFLEEPYELVEAAVTALIKVRVNSYPPSIGEVSEQIQRLVRPNEMTAMEAWALVSNALKGSAYGYKALFDALPPMVQRVVGSPSQLHEWSMMDVQTVQSVIASNFAKSYTAIVQRQRQHDALPPAVREYMERLGSGDTPVIRSLEG